MIYQFEINISELLGFMRLPLVIRRDKWIRLQILIFCKQNTLLSEEKKYYPLNILAMQYNCYESSFFPTRKKNKMSFAKLPNFTCILFPLLLFEEAGNLSTLSADLTPQMEILPLLRHILTLNIWGVCHLEKRTRGVWFLFYAGCVWKIAMMLESNLPGACDVILKWGHSSFSEPTDQWREVSLN